MKMMKLRILIAKLANRAAKLFIWIANRALGNKDLENDNKTFNSPQELREWLDKNGMRDVDVIVFDTPPRRPLQNWRKETLH